MDTKEVVKKWFYTWEEGGFMDLPISENFKHTSPYGIINGKKQYINLVEANKDKFLGHNFELHDEIYGKQKACVRYTAIQGNYRLEVSEWYFIKNNLIEEVLAYYNIEGDIPDERKLSKPDDKNIF